MPGKKKAVKKSVKKRMGGGMMGPKKKMARGGAVKKRGGGMMGPKKKMAKGGKVKRKAPAASLFFDKIRDSIRAKKEVPTGRSAAAKKAAMKGVKTKGGNLVGKLKQGKGNPAGKDKSFLGRRRERENFEKELGLTKKRK